MPPGKCMCSPGEQARDMRAPIFKAAKCPCTKCKERQEQRQAAKGQVVASTDYKLCAGRQLGVDLGSGGCGGGGPGPGGYGFRGAYAASSDCGCSAVVAQRNSGPSGICGPMNTNCGGNVGGNAGGGGGGGGGAGGGCPGGGGCGSGGGGPGGRPNPNGICGQMNTNCGPGHGNCGANAGGGGKGCVGGGGGGNYGGGGGGNYGGGGGGNYGGQGGYGGGGGGKFGSQICGCVGGMQGNNVQQRMAQAMPGFPCAMQGADGRGASNNQGYNMLPICTAEDGCGPGCGPDTGCDPSCHLRGPVGVSMFGNEQVNFFITFLMEILGILVFFAVCTITFWITIGYYIVTLLIDLKNADRNVQIAVAVIVGLLVIAFAITLVTGKNGPCCKGKSGKSKSKPCPKCVAKAKAKIKGAACSGKKCVKNTCAKKSAGSCAAHQAKLKAKLKVKPPPKPAASKCSKPKCKGNPKSKCNAKCMLKNKGAKGNTKPNIKMARGKAGGKPGRKYNDCEGRAIFQSSRRYAIPTEMKQPPTVVVWLRDTIQRLLHREG